MKEEPMNLTTENISNVVDIKDYTKSVITIETQFLATQFNRLFNGRFAGKTTKVFTLIMKSLDYSEPPQTEWQTERVMKTLLEHYPKLNDEDLNLCCDIYEKVTIGLINILGGELLQNIAHRVHSPTFKDKLMLTNHCVYGSEDTVTVHFMMYIKDKK